MPEVGNTAPDFELTSTDGINIKLSDMKGRKVILYFYPKDSTPGCTKEACDLRDSFSEIKQYAVLLGISADSLESHKKFTDKHSLPFPLLADTEHIVSENYGVWMQKSMFGKKYMGIQRSTFLIDEKGIITKVWPKVNVLTHAKEVLESLK
ncbi:MAG: thioredoxin-dependent thiol peroxidase [bacterium]